MALSAGGMLLNARVLMNVCLPGHSEEVAKGIESFQGPTPASPRCLCPDLPGPIYPQHPAPAGLDPDPNHHVRDQTVPHTCQNKPLRTYILTRAPARCPDMGSQPTAQGHGEEKTFSWPSIRT